MRTRTLLATTFTLTIITLSLTVLPAVLSKPSAFPEILIATPRDLKPNGCVNCHQTRTEIGRDFKLSTLTSNIRNHTQDTTDTISSSEIPTTCKSCHLSELGNEVHIIHLGYEINPEKNSTASYTGECLYCHAQNQSTGEMRVKTGYENRP